MARMARPCAKVVQMTELGRSTSADPRLLQANERTLLAWVRTGISLVAFGFVIARFSLSLAVPGPGAVAARHATPWIGVVFVVLGILANSLAVKRYASARAAILKNEGFPLGDPMPVVFTCLVTVACVVIGTYLFMSL